jgi:hypothetical protein
MKILQVRDHNSELEIHLPFSEGEFEAFVNAMSSGISRIVQPGARSLPLLPRVLRNGD